MTHYSTVYLRILLENLPATLPLVTDVSFSIYKFNDFYIEDEDVNDMGLVGAVNRQLEVRLGPRTGRADTFAYKERGPGVEALASVLEQYCSEFPDDIILRKWVDDACRAAELVYQDASVPFPMILDPELEDAPDLSQDDQGPRKKGKSRAGASGRAHKRPDTQVLDSFDDGRYLDVEEPKDTRRGGARVEPILLDVSRLYLPHGGDPGSVKTRVRCVGSRQCNTTWAAPRNRKRILDHAMGCSWVPLSTRDKVCAVLAGSETAKASVPARRKRDEEFSDAQDSDDSDAPPTTRSRTADTSDTSSLRSTEPPEDRPVIRMGSTSEPPLPASFSAFREKGGKELKGNGDRALVLFLVGCGVPPSVVDSGFFKNFINSIQPKYKPPCATTVRDSLVPREAAQTHVKTIEELRDIRHLTISFDGGKIRRPRGVYTVTVTTPVSRKSYLIDLHDVSRVSHTAEYLKSEVIIPALEKVGPENVSGVVSDNTGNTRKTRELIAALFPHILNLQDCCHEMNLALLQINELDEFKEMIQNVKDILSYMHHSTFAMERYNDVRKDLNISTGLAHIGKTRFWTYVSAVESVYQGLPVFREIVSNQELSIDIASKNYLLERGSVDASYFEISLVQYLSVTTPFARAIKCLEAATTTAADVYAFWLAIMSRLEIVMASSSRTKLATHTMEDIRAIANQRFKELLDDGAEDIYLTAFFLDPRYRDAPALKTENPNPLAIAPIRIPGRRDIAPASAAASRTAATPTVTPEPSGRDKLIGRVGRYLQDLLLREYGGMEMIDRKDILAIMKGRNSLLSDIPPIDALDRLRAELKAYAATKDPFDRELRPEQTVLQWWKRMHKDQYGKVLAALAIKIFSIVPHSMADERFMSDITWINSARRSGQTVQTVSNQVKIRQYHLSKGTFAHLDTTRRQRKSTPLAPTVRRWCDLDKRLRRADSSHQSDVERSDDEDVDNTAADSDDGMTDSEDNERREREKRAYDRVVGALSDGANLGDLSAERRRDFIANDSGFDIRSRFFREMLADDSEVMRPPPQVHNGAGPVGAVAGSSRGTKTDVLPSQVNWAEWPGA